MPPLARTGNAGKTPLIGHFITCQLCQNCDCVSRLRQRRLTQKLAEKELPGLVELGHIADFAQQVAQAISAVLDIEVQVIDRHLRLIAGTGIYFARINDIFDATSACHYVMTKERPIIIEQARKHEICLKCVYRGTCVDLAEICYPILIKGLCVGVIAFIAEREEQQQSLIAKKDHLFLFIEKISAMLSYALHSNELNQQVSLLINSQQTIMNSIQEGLISVDSHEKITFVNRSAASLIGVSPEALMSKPLGSVFQSPQEILSCMKTLKTAEMEFFTIASWGTRHCFGTVTPIIGYDGHNGLVICFKGIEAMPNLVRKYLGKEQKITLDDILGKSQAIQNAKRRAFQVAGSDSSVLITGESGTGKEMFARAIHYASARASRPLISINCGAIPEGLLESELFGYEEGAFTGAKKGGKPGQFELAHNGTLFLDEIGDMPLHLQGKLLRAIEDRQIQRVGGTKPVFINVRIIAATNKNFDSLLLSGEFREDLYYRLNVIPLHIAPLRERPEDIESYALYFTDKYNALLHKQIGYPTREVLDRLGSYSWPGNVRELENAIEYAINMESGTQISVASLPDRIFAGQPRRANYYVKDLERKMISDAITRHANSGNAVKNICTALGISRSTLYRKLKEYNLQIKTYAPAHNTRPM